MFRVIKINIILIIKLLLVIYIFFALPAKSETKETLRLLDLFGKAFEKTYEDYVEEITERN